jgi:hypothetical protein
VGRQTEVLRRSPNSPRLRRLKWLIGSEEEMRVALWREEHASWAWDQAEYERLNAEAGDLGAPTINTPRHNIQDLYLNSMGVQNTVYALCDYPETCEAYFRSPKLFAKYLLPVYQEHAELLHRAGKFVCSHWDGDTKPLLPFARETGLDGIEAITPEPQGDVTLEEVRAALGDRMVLLDGIPAILFDRRYPLRELMDCARRVIDLFAPRLVLGISDEISSSGEIERLLPIRDLVDQHNAG